MRNFFIGKSKEWLEEALGNAQQELANGAVLTGGGAGDQSFTQEAKTNLEARIANLYYALNKLDAAAYPEADCNPTTRTRGVFRDC